jgi:hypothetical protein
MFVIRRRSFYDSSAVHFRITPGDFDNPFRSLKIQIFSDSHQGCISKRNQFILVKIQIIFDSHQGCIQTSNTKFRSLKIKIFSDSHQGYIPANNELNR